MVYGLPAQEFKATLDFINHCLAKRRCRSGIFDALRILQTRVRLDTHADAIKTIYDNFDFMRGVQAFLTGISATSVRATCIDLDAIGIKANQSIALTEDLMDARSLFFTPNTTRVCGFVCLDLSNGPMVLTVPTGALGPEDDAIFRWVTDVGLTGPDVGKGGSYLFVPPGYTKDYPTDGYFVQKPTTNTLLFFFRAFVQNCDVAGAVAHVKRGTNLHPVQPPRKRADNFCGA